VTDHGAPACDPPSATALCRRGADALFCALPVLLSAWVHRSILGNYFIGDDFLHLYTIANNGLGEFLLTPYGGHVYVARNLIFYACYRAFGLDARWYFASVLLTHVVAVALLCRVILRLTRGRILACFGAILWGTCPATEGTLSWYTAFGQVLATVITLWLLDDVLRIADRGVPPSHRRVAAWFLLLMAAATCFGVGIAVAMTFFVVLFLLMPDPAGKPLALLFLAQLVIAPALFFGVHHAYVVVSGVPINQGAEAVRHLRHWQPIPEMVGRLLSYGVSTLVLPFPNRDYSVAAAATAVYAAGVGIGLACGAPPVRRALSAFVVMIIAVYGTIAAGRAPVLSMFPNWNRWGAMAEHYHYLAPALITVTLCLLLGEAGRVVRPPPSLAAVILGVWVAAGLRYHEMTTSLLKYHEPARRETAEVLQSIDQAIDATAGPDVYITNRRFVPILWATDAAGFPGWAALFIITHPSDVVRGKRVHFIDDNAQILAMARAHPGSRINRLVIAPGSAPGGAAVPPGSGSDRQ